MAPIDPLGYTLTDLVFSTALRLLGKITFDSRVIGELDALPFSSRLKSFVRQLKPCDTRQGHRASPLHRELFTCPYDFIPVDSVRKPLRPSYVGPFRVIDWREKYFAID